MTSDHKFNKNFGIRPRKGPDIWKIVSFIFLHSSYKHVFFNWVPSVVMAFVLLQRTGWRAIFAFVIAWGGGGIFVWIAGTNEVHIGFEIITACLWMYCLCCGIMSRAIVVLCAALAGGAFSLFLVVGLKFNVHGIRWDSLLFGGFVGTVMYFVSYRFCGGAKKGGVAGANGKK